MGSTVCGIAIPQSSQNTERVLMFMNWLESDQENYDSVMYGIKGETYNLKGEEVVDPTACLSWAWRAPFLNEKLERGNPAISKKDLDNYIDTVKQIAKYPPHTGFVPDYTAVKDIANRREVEYLNIGMRMFVKNDLTQDDINKYIQNEKDSGVDELIANIQKQLDEWVAANKK
jgi:putative aldouronate transport system substrate-binding protein